MRIPLLMAIILILVSLAVDAYIYFDLRRNFVRNKSYRRVYNIFSYLCWIFLLVCILIPRREADRGISFIMWGIFAYLSVYIPKIVFVVFSLIGGIPVIIKRKSLKLGKYIGLPLAILTFIMMWWGALVTRNQLEIVNVEIYSPKLPESFNGYKIVHISDLHVGTWGDDTRFISKLCDSVNAQHPDLILFTGDIVNRQTRELEPFMKDLSRLKAKDGVYSVLGNHDYGDYIEWDSAEEKESNLQLLKNWQNQIGWKLLNNEHTEIVAGNDTIQLIGVENWGEPPFKRYGALIDAYPASTDSIKHLNDNRFKILLTHNPEHWMREVTQISNIDLTLSGHTHAMQIEFKSGDLKWSPAVFKYAAWGGLYNYQSADSTRMKIYVNIGAGEVGMPFRIGAVPEITVITLHNGEDSRSTPYRKDFTDSANKYSY